MRSNLGYVEGMRGLAALMVYIHHFIGIFLPFMFDRSAKDWGIGERIIGQSPANIVLNGNFMVCLFFVLSGYVLSRAACDRGRYAQVGRSMAKRLPRLLLPALASVLIGWSILVGDSANLYQATHLSGNNWTNRFIDMPPLGVALMQAAIGAFTAGGDKVNPVLWTICVEIYGSAIVFGLVVIPARWRLYACAYLSLPLFVLFGTFYAAFPIGVAIAAMPQADRHPWLFGAVAAAGLFLGSYPYYGAEAGMWYWLPVFPVAAPLTVYHIIGAACLLQSVIMSPVKHWFDHAVFRFLGRISFSLYLIHFTILSSLTCWMVLRLEPLFGYLPAIGIAFAVTMPVTLAASYVFCRLIDEPSTRLADRFARGVVAFAGAIARYRAAALAE